MAEHLTLVLGGARSGKSALAERLARETGRPLTYVATCLPADDEMRARVEEHRKRRGAGWRTIEAPRDLPQAVAGVPDGQVCLIDCLTLWASNRMAEGADPDADSRSLLAALTASGGRLICVSNEIGMGLVPENAVGRRFRDIQGRLNQAVAGQADTVVFVAAGLPLTLKGGLPEPWQ
ncbi:MAG: bifunctional adenosylcobinamide kinase/adenosylcobinamide-phosphate guanylyltransferase [Paracoccaceae bacterium]